MTPVELQIKHLIAEMQKYYDDIIAVYKTNTLNAEIDKEPNAAVKRLLIRFRNICAENNIIIKINTHLNTLEILKDRARIYHAVK